MRPYNFNQIPSMTHVAKNIPSSIGMGQTELPITTLNNYNDTTGSIDSSGSSIESLLVPSSSTSTTSGLDFGNLLILAGLAYGAYWFYENYMNKKTRSAPSSISGISPIEVLD
jgi:hypothetical protein